MGTAMDVHCILLPRMKGGQDEGGARAATVSVVHDLESACPRPNATREEQDSHSATAIPGRAVCRRRQPAQRRPERRQPGGGAGGTSSSFGFLTWTRRVSPLVEPSLHAHSDKVAHRRPCGGIQGEGVHRQGRSIDAHSSTTLYYARCYMTKRSIRPTQYHHFDCQNNDPTRRSNMLRWSNSDCQSERENLYSSSATQQARNHWQLTTLPVVPRASGQTPAGVTAASGCDRDTAV